MKKETKRKIILSGNEANQPVYKGDDVTDAEFEIQINEKWKERKRACYFFKM